MQPKFAEGTSQHTLLKNRIKALSISITFIRQQDVSALYTMEELHQALPPITSIIHKCKKGQSKFKMGTSQYQRFVPLIRAMSLSLLLLNEEIAKRG